MPNGQPLNEEKFEKHIVHQLHVLHGYLKRKDEDHYDAEKAMDPELVLRFIEATQSEAVERLKEMYGDGWGDRVLARLDSELTDRGVIDVLRKGIQEGPVALTMFYARPTSSLNEETGELFAQNIFSAIRQVYFNTLSDTEYSVDFVLFVNGVPVATCELKNETTGQTYQNAISQYKRTRDPNHKLFSFKRCIAHFAMDTSEAHITTHLNGEGTYFLPYNLGHDGGAGNPPVEGQHKTHYIWEELWSRESWSDLVTYYARAFEEGKEDLHGNEYTEEVQVFPRFQQRRAVERVLDAAQNEGAGRNYLIQHSAGSGKSLTIAWLAYRLAELHDQNDETVFDTVLVLTDRRALDTQLRDTIRALLRTPGVLRTVGQGQTAQHLLQYLEEGAKVITSTIQKFPVIADAVAELPGKRFAVIIDEAHSSQSGELARAVHQALGEEATAEDWLNQQMESRTQPDNLSYIAFTATPKLGTLEKFGEAGAKPFDLYSMRQAIKEGFILDVLTNYTSYKTYFKLVQEGVDAEVPQTKAVQVLMRYVNTHPDVIEQKVEVIVAHFEQTVRQLIRGEAKAMIVTSGREAAVRYKIALDAYLREQGLPHETLVAFTDSITVDGESYTESGMNGFSESQTAKQFKHPKYRFLVVAQKYQTGFDEPLLAAMYVEKRLANVNAVQTLSRLNRMTKDKDAVFVLDFRNEPEEIRDAFSQYYEGVRVEEGTDINALNDIRTQIQGLYEPSLETLDAFVETLRPGNENFHEQANALLDAAAQQILGDLDEEGYKRFRQLASHYVKHYPYLAQVIGYTDVNHEKLYLFLKFLLKKLPVDRTRPPIEILDDVDLEALRIVRKRTEALELDAGESAVDELEGIPEPELPEIKDWLSEIVQRVNERWGAEFGPDQQASLNRMTDEIGNDGDFTEVVRSPHNDRSGVATHFGRVFEGKLADEYENDRVLFEKLSSRDDLKSFVRNQMFNFLYRKASETRERENTESSRIDA